MAKDKAIFSTIHECNTKQIFVGDDRSLGVVGSGTVPVENGHFSDVPSVPKISCNLLSVYQITHSGEGKTVMFTPHQVVIKDFKNPQNVLATGTVDDITSVGNNSRLIIIPMQMPIFIQITWRLGFTFPSTCLASYYLFIYII